MGWSKNPGSFRDPSGFVFRRDGSLYRQVNKFYADTYDKIQEAGLFDSLADSSLLIGHKEVGIEYAATSDAHRVIAPVELPFVSYPYEWSFSQLKAAALLTLDLQSKALDAEFSLKDGSAYNVQFIGSQPVFVDTLSFEPYLEGEPWIAYRQFCEHFLAPLALMSMTDIRLGMLLRTNIDGIPLDLASRLLPIQSRLRFGLLTHIHWHAAAQKRHEHDASRPTGRKISRFQTMALLASLRATVEKLEWKTPATTWGDYYSNTNYSEAAMRRKETLVGEMISSVSPSSVWDLGANDGTFSRLAAGAGIPTVSMDFDPVAVELNYRQCASADERVLHPLLIDLTNPSPSLGWSSSERDSLLGRGPADLVLALALVHHLAIGNNVPLDELARFFTSVGRSVVIEFIPKSDSQVKRMLATRRDIFSEYNRDGFEKAFRKKFEIARADPIEGTDRIMYLMQRLG